MDEKLLLDNIKNIYRRISHAAMRAGRSPEEVRLIAVTKKVDEKMILKALDIGLRDFGENRIQEAKDKLSNLKSQISDYKVIWHLIGHLQKNKAKTAVEFFELIHSVDSIELAEIIDRNAEKFGKIQNILIQVKLSDEDAKHGISKHNIIGLLSRIANMENLHVLGLMTMPPYFDNPEMARPYFKELREVRDFAIKNGFTLSELSMGMSNDFEVAIEEGATMVRVGTAIFGERGL